MGYSSSGSPRTAKKKLPRIGLRFDFNLNLSHLLSYSWNANDLCGTLCRSLVLGKLLGMT